MSVGTRAGGDGTPRVELWVRETTPYGVTDLVRSIHDRFRELERRGGVADVDLDVWGRSVAVSGDAVGHVPEPLNDKVAEFRTWAEGEGYTLEPAFSVRERNAATETGTDAVLVLPVVCVALYDGSDLLAVFPHADDGEVRRVCDCLDGLERGEPVAVRE